MIALKTKYQCLFLWRKIKIPINAPTAPKKYVKNNKVFSLIRHLLWIAFLLSTKYKEIVTIENKIFKPTTIKKAKCALINSNILFYKLKFKVKDSNCVAIFDT